MRMRRRWWLLVGVGLCLMPCSCCLWDLQPFAACRQSDEAIRAEILHATPLGSTMEAVEQYAKSRFTAFYHQAPGPHREPDSIWIADDEGKLYLAVLYGSHRNLNIKQLSTTVDVSWHFSDDGKLSKIYVNRHEGPGLLDLFNQGG